MAAIEKRTFDAWYMAGDFSILHTHSMPVVVVLVLWGSSQDLPQKWSPHRLVDIVPMHNAVETECFVHLPWLAMFFAL